jgi:hypothetical protein
MAVFERGSSYYNVSSKGLDFGYTLGTETRSQAKTESQVSVLELFGIVDEFWQVGVQAFRDLSVLQSVVHSQHLAPG